MKPIVHNGKEYAFVTADDSGAYYRCVDAIRGKGKADEIFVARALLEKKELAEDVPGQKPSGKPGKVEVPEPAKIAPAEVKIKVALSAKKAARLGVQ